MSIIEKIALGIVAWVATPYLWLLASFIYRRHRNTEKQELPPAPLESKGAFVERVLSIVDRRLSRGGAQ